jgi:hypothetical protein
MASALEAYQALQSLLAVRDQRDDRVGAREPSVETTIEEHDTQAPSPKRQRYEPLFFPWSGIRVR